MGGHRKRTSSSETPIERIPQPSATERSRSVEMIHGVERIELERSKTENIISSSADTSVLESSSSSLGQIHSNTKLMSLSLGRGQSLSSGNRLDSNRSRSNSKEFLESNFEEGSGKMSDVISSALSDEASIQEYIGQTFPLVKNIDRNEFVVSSTATTISLSERKHPTSQPLPSQVASITRSNFHTYSQPPLSNTSGINDDYLHGQGHGQGQHEKLSMNFTPSSSSGKKINRSITNSQKRHQNNLNGVALASLESTPSSSSHGGSGGGGGGGGSSHIKGKETTESTPKSSQQNTNFISPPRKIIDLSSQPLFTTPPPPSTINTSSHIFLSKEKSSHHRNVMEKISLSGTSSSHSHSNHPSSRSNSPMTKKDFDDNENKMKSKVFIQNEESLETRFSSEVATRVSRDDDAVGGAASDEHHAEVNDRLVREKLQEVKAMNRQDSSNGAVMYRFSLWKGVQRKDPIPDISLPRKVIESNETPSSRPPRSAAATADMSDNSSQKKSGRRRGPRAIIEAQDGVSNADNPSLLRSKPSTTMTTAQASHSNSKPTPIHPEISRQSPFALRKGSSPSSLHRKESSEEEEEEEEKYSESSDDNENFSEELHHSSSSGRAYAFRNMVGSCKTSNLSCGSIAESIQTELGVPQFYLNTSVGVGVENTVGSVESLSSEDDHEQVEGDEEISLANSEYDDDDEEEDAAILGIALEHDSSFISDDDHRDDSEVDQSSATQDSLRGSSFRQQTFQPKFSLELSLEEISQQPHQSSSSQRNGPPLMKKRRDHQSRHLILEDEEDEADGDATTANPSGGSILVSASLPELPTTKTKISSSQMIRRKSASSSSSSGHTKRIREMTSAAKLESTVDETAAAVVPAIVVVIDQLQESRKTDTSSPSLLSEASEYDTFENDSHLEDKNYQDPITSTTDDVQRVQPQHHHHYQQQQQQYPNVNSSKRQSLPSDEIYSIHEFQWKKGNEILGEGSFGQVFKGMNCSTGELLAVKQICLTDGTEEEVNTLRHEIDLMDSLKHPNIVR
jgi:hypothetical protein